MQVFNLTQEAEFNPAKHVEKILGRLEGGDFTVACWEPGQISPYHCHPDATEIYFCFEGGGTMRTPNETIAVTPGAFVVHPPGEVHEYANGAARTLLSASATGRIWRRATGNGAAGRGGRKAPPTPSITGRIR
jgi:quercetin dioxygenase-like cupin family protein